MNFKKRATSLLIVATVLFGSINISFADGTRVVSIGTNLTQEQKETMLKYFGVKKDEVMIFEVNNEQERKYLEGIIPNSQIGSKTYSCAYVEPTSSDKINVKTVNLTYITSNIISSAVATATGGEFGANIVAGSPFAVSGTGALTGVLLALEDATGKELDEDKKELANEEMVVTGEISEDIGAEKATGVINSIKTEIIKNNTSDVTQIAETINNVSNNYNITLNVDQQKKIEELMLKIAEQDYNYKEMKGTLESINKDINSKLDEMGESIQTGILDTIKGWFTGFGDWFSNLFSSKNDDLGILENTNDSLLGENVKIDATDKNAINLPSSEEVEGFFAKIWNWFTGLFNNNKSEELNTNEVNNNEVLFDENPSFEIDDSLTTESNDTLDNATVENSDMSIDNITEEDINTYDSNSELNDDTTSDDNTDIEE